MSDIIIPEGFEELRKFAGNKRRQPLIYPFALGELDTERLPECHMTPAWKAGVEKDMWWGSRRNILEYGFPHEGRPLVEDIPDFLRLRDILLSIGGDNVCFPAMEEDMNYILKYGQLWYGDKAILKRGRPSKCHQNSCDLWVNNKEVTRICTGYALSSDGLWRQHSWLVWCRPRVNTIVETTVKRIAYYGYVMNTARCEQFDEDNF